MQTTYKVGDKVRILGTENIFLGEEIKIVGWYAEVESVSNEGCPRLACRDGAPLIITKSELKYIKKVEESDAKMTQFKVGDKVRVINAYASKHSNGDEGVVVSITPIWGAVFIDVEVDGVQQGHYAKDIELVSPKQTKNQRLTSAEQAISTLEQKVEAMQAEIDTLKAAQKPPVTVIADAIKRYKERTPNEQASANEKRKAIIDEAKAFVEEKLLEVDEQEGWRTTKIPLYKEKGRLRVNFHVNKKKRTVVALAYFGNLYPQDKEVVGKGIAKCNPSDVFNEHIGKAIALGRALGLDVERFEKAVQPSEVVTGMHVDTYYIGSDEKNETCPTFVTHVLNGMPAFGNGTHSSVFKITDDTEAQY